MVRTVKVNGFAMHTGHGSQRKNKAIAEPDFSFLGNPVACLYKLKLRKDMRTLIVVLRTIMMGEHDVSHQQSAQIYTQK